MPTVSCPSCDRVLEVEYTYRDWTVRCPHCANEFVPSEAAPAAFESEERPRRRRDPDSHPDDYDYERPRRRRAEWDRRDAEDVVRAPGLWLELCGWGGALTLMGGAVFWILAGAGARNNPNANGDDGVAVLMALFSGLCAVPYAVVMIVGGRKMRALSGYGWAMTASVLGIASVGLFCFACVFAFIPVVFGIWGVTALINPVVSQAFEDARDRPRDWDD